MFLGTIKLGCEGKYMVILGIDPGYAIVGYGAICISKSRFYPVGYGAILTDASQDFPARLNIIYDKMLKILNACHPNAVAVEKLYFQNNQKTAIQVAEARGVILLAAKERVYLFMNTHLYK